MAKQQTAQHYRRRARLSLGLCALWFAVGLFRLVTHHGSPWELPFGISWVCLTLLTFSNASRHERGLPIYDMRTAWHDIQSPQAERHPDALRFLVLNGVALFFAVLAIVVGLAGLT